MSACPCGGVALKAKSEGTNAVLRYLCCGACGRCGRWELHIRGRRVTQGEMARRAFNDARVIEQILRRIR